MPERHHDDKNPGAESEVFALISAGTACGERMLAVQSVIRNSVGGLWFPTGGGPKATLLLRIFTRWWWQADQPPIDAFLSQSGG